MNRSIRRVSAVLILCFVAIAAGLTYWQVIYAPTLVYGPNNARLAREEQEIQRGRIFDSAGQQLAYNHRISTGYQRVYTDKTLSQTIGYFSSRYGSAGLEATFAKY